MNAFRTLLERELDTVEVEFGRAPLEDVTLDLELGQGSWSIGEADDDEDDDDGDEDQQDVGGQNEQQDEQVEGHAPAVASVTPNAKKRATKADVRRSPEGEEGDDSLWLSSIMTDRKDEDAE